MTRTKFRTARIVLLILYLAIATAYSLVNPAFESPDELLHFDYVESLLRTGHLPIAVLTPGAPGSVTAPHGAELTENFQAPLYYAAGALVTAWLPPGRPAPEVVERNPFWVWRIGEVGVDNKSQFLHGPEQNFPWTGIWLRLHLLRFLSILVGLIAVWQTGEFALLIWPRRYETALLATAFIAFLPQFVYLASSVTNDVAVVALSALSAVALGRLLRSLSQKSRDVRRALWFGLFLGLGVLAEVSIMSVCAVAFGTLALYLFVNRRSTPRPSWSNLGIAVLPTITVTIPFFVRNWLLYGELTGLGRMDAIWGRRTPPLPWPQTLPEVPLIWTSAWARFGYGQIPIPNAIYVACLILTVIALVGLVLGIVRQVRAFQAATGAGVQTDNRVTSARSSHFSRWSHAVPWREGRIWLFAYASFLVVALFVALLRYTRISPTGSFGREAFSALPAAAVLFAGGWTELFVTYRRPVIALAMSSLMLAFSVWALTAILRPAFVLPTHALAASSEPIAEQAGLRLSDVATLSKVRLLNPTLVPGEDALLEVEWLPLRKTAKPLIFFARLVSPENKVLGDRDSYPGLGRTSTTYWEPGQVFTDIYRIPVDSNGARAAAPAQIRVWVGLYDRATDQLLQATEWPSGNLVPGIVAEGRLPAEQKQPGKEPGPVLATFGDNLELSAAHFPATLQPGTTAPITLEWTVLNPLPYDCKLFIHLAPVDQTKPVAQVDEPIMRDRYPRHLWVSGELLEDSHQIEIPVTLAPGTYRFLAGVYRDEPGWPRLPIVTAAGPVPEDAYVLGAVQVVDAVR